MENKKNDVSLALTLLKITDNLLKIWTSLTLDLTGS